MKRVIKNRLFLVLFTAIICIIGSVYATTRYLASEIEYKDTTVENALNDLYTVHEIYKNLNTETNFTANDLISGKTAYNSNGELITGVVNECVKGSFIYQSSYSTSGYKIVSFNPSYFVLSGINKSTNIRRVFYYNEDLSSSNLYDIEFRNIGANTNTVQTFALGSNFIINDGLIVKWNADSWSGQSIFYIACK